MLHERSMIKLYENKKVIALSFTLSLFAMNAEAKKSSDFDDEQPIVCQNINYHSASTTNSKTAIEDRESSKTEQQIPASFYAGGLSKATRVNRTKVVPTPYRGLTAVLKQEKNVLLDSTPGDETDETQTTSEDEEGVFETIGYTREILGREIATPADIFVEVG